MQVARDACFIENQGTSTTLYFQKRIEEINYLNVATELAKLVFSKDAKTNESLFYQVSHRLTASEQQLKSEIIPYGRLMATGELVESQHRSLLRPLFS